MVAQGENLSRPTCQASALPGKISNRYRGRLQNYRGLEKRRSPRVKRILVRGDGETRKYDTCPELAR